MSTRKSAQHRFGELVKEQRERRRPRWTQRALADKLADQGVAMHWTTIAKIEKGQRQVSIDEAAAFANVFGCSVDALLGRRARPTADRDFALQRLHESTTTAARSAQVSVRDIGQALAELAAIDQDGQFTEAIAAAQKACAAGDDWARQLAQVGGTIAETRGNRAVWRAVRVKEDDDA
jgi:hypothetical protein